MSWRTVASPCLLVSCLVHASSDTEVCPAVSCLTDVKSENANSQFLCFFSVHGEESVLVNKPLLETQSALEFQRCLWDHGRVATVDGTQSQCGRKDNGSMLQGTRSLWFKQRTWDTEEAMTGLVFSFEGIRYCP